MEKQTIEVDGRFFEVPEYIEENKLDQFADYCRLRLEWEALDKTYDLGHDVICTFPRVQPKHKKMMLGRPKAERDEFERKRKTVQDHLVKMMHAKAKIAQKTQKQNKQELEDRTAEILQLFGQEHSVSEVHKIYKNQGINIAYPSLLRFAKRNDEKIRELRNKWREDIDDVSISIKRSRLEKLNFLLNDLLQHYEDSTPLNKINYSKEIRGILDQARKEVEGEEIKLTVSGRIDIEATISSYINESQILRDLTIHQIVVSRVAARLGIPYGAIIERLANSFYSQFNGFRANNDLSTKILYPSSTNYDILDLEKKNHELKQVEHKPTPTTLINPQQKARISVSREKINKKIEELLKRTEAVKKAT